MLAAGDLRERVSLQVRIDAEVANAEIARIEERYRDAGAHIMTAFELHRALRRLDKAIWFATEAALLDAGCVLVRGGAA